ncbi:MAG TPA: hypothetical protein VHW65_08535 [Gemmatimonadales bacterium]|jgi:hypothetical protein|nr:hypothetical protein [Gemmatimonadales bacterium]
MRLYQQGAAITALVLAAIAPQSASAQRTDSYTWKLGLDGGIMAFRTQTQNTKVIPSAGAHILIMERRAGLQFGVDEGIGSNEKTAPSNLILFNDIRRYQAMLMAFPVAGSIEPYFGIGGGILQVVGPRVDPTSTAAQDPATAATLLTNAQQESASGFFGALAGVQGKSGRITIFAQGQIDSSPGSSSLLRSELLSLLGGIRISLGSAREGVAAGGY